jgi:hypothetical protein
MPSRRHFGLILLAPLGACALPPNTALRDWAWTASIAADRPSEVAPDEAALAMQQGLVAWLYALGVLAVPEQTLTFRAAEFAALEPRAAAGDPAAGAAIGRIGAVLAAARAGNLAPGARANSAFPAPLVEDGRLRPALRAADPPVQVVAGALGRATETRGEYARLVAAIAEDHAMIAAQARHIEAREVARRIQAAEDRLRRLVLRLPPDAAVAARGGAAGPATAMVQP